MIIDHIGCVLQSGVILTEKIFFLGKVFRIIGRFSMPLFAYCIARGFDHYVRSGNLKIKKYFRNIFFIAVLSQLPFSFFRYQIRFFSKNNNSKEGFESFSFFSDLVFNICFVWLISLLLLCVLNKISFSAEKNISGFLNKKNLIFMGIAVAICVASIFVKVEYGLYGVLFPVVFYYCCFKFDNLFILFICNIFLYFIYCLKNLSFMTSSGQIFVPLLVFLLPYLQKRDKLIKLPKFVFYWFYPVHLAVFDLLYLTVF